MALAALAALAACGGAGDPGAADGDAPYARVTDADAAPADVEADAALALADAADDEVPRPGVATALDAAPAATLADTIVWVLVTDGGDGFVYCDGPCGESPS